MLEFFLNRTFDHARYGLKPRHRCLSAHITMNDSIPSKILCGTVKVKGDIEHFTTDGIVFKGDGGKVTPCDIVVLGTGYKTLIPFLPEKVLPQIRGNKVRLYKNMFIPYLKHPETLAIIGLFQTVGAGIPACEMQCRWYAALIKNKDNNNNNQNRNHYQLPSREVMEAEIDRKWKKITERYYDSERHTFQEDWLPYLDDIAKEIGCRPPIFRYLFTDPKLFRSLVFGVAVPYQFRLVGK